MMILNPKAHLEYMRLDPSLNQERRLNIQLRLMCALLLLFAATSVWLCHGYIRERSNAIYWQEIALTSTNPVILQLKP